MLPFCALIKSICMDGIIIYTLNLRSGSVNMNSVTSWEAYCEEIMELVKRL
uniref:Uncharacterized protein n=1 Tax=Anguilla anguilla TaxID=7936 RepID=A0A0E9WTB4_ANGAN